MYVGVHHAGSDKIIYDIGMVILKFIVDILFNEIIMWTIIIHGWSVVNFIGVIVAINCKSYNILSATKRGYHSWKKLIWRLMTFFVI